MTKIGLSDLVLHDLRRSGIRCMVRGGTPEVVGMKISGHKTRATFDRYDITSERFLREAVKRTQAYIAKRSRGKKNQKDSSGA